MKGFANILFIILDGLADRPQPVLGGKTPLEAARTPHMDRLADLGASGLLIPLAPGIPLESETSHFLLFGYPLEKFPGRAVFEAAGRGIDVPGGCVAFLASFATVTVEQGLVRRQSILWEAHRPEDEKDCRLLSQGIARYECGGISFTLEECGRCEGILRLTGEVSRYVSDSDPFYDGAYVVGVVPLDEAHDKERARKTAEAMNDYLSWVHFSLAGHPLNRKRKETGLPPINFLLTKWAAVQPSDSASALTKRV